MSDSPGRFSWTAVLSASLLIALFVTLFYLPLRPTAWGGPRGTGPFEEGTMPASGRWARDFRINLELLAKSRSPQHGIVATAEVLVGYHALLVAAKLGVLWLILFRLGQRSWLATLCTVAVAVPMFLGAPRQTERDVGLLLFAILIAGTSCFRPNWRMMAVGLPVLFALWVNAHASALLGLIWLGVITLGRTVEWFRTPEGSARPAVLRFIVSIVLCAAAMCVNPDGPRVFVDAVLAAKNGNLSSLPEYRPIDFNSHTLMPWVYFGTIGILFLVQLICSRSFSPMTLIVVLTFGIWPLLQVRALDYWWLIVVWLIVREIAIRRVVQGRSASEAHTISQKLSLASASALDFWPGVPRRMKRAIVGAFILAFIATPFAHWLIFGQPRGLKAILTKDTPLFAVSEIKRIPALPDLRDTLDTQYPEGRFRGAILAGEEQGDFLAWELDGENDRPVMLYSRPETLGKEHWNECHRVLDGSSDWWEITDRHQTNLIVIVPDRFPKLAERLRRAKEWRTVQDDALLIAVRREPRLPAELMRP